MTILCIALAALSLFLIARIRYWQRCGAELAQYIDELEGRV